MAGTVGTALMLLEASQLGAVIYIDEIPRPAEIPLEDWLLAFPSFGFLLSVAPEHASAIINRFAARGITAAAIGRTDASGIVRLADGTGEEIFWHFGDEPLIGCAGEGIK
jgi:selenophosphate synthetase-related protein